MTCRVQIGLLLALALLIITGQASAHSRSESFSLWQVGSDGMINGSLSMRAREATRIPRAENESADFALVAYMADHLTVAGPEGACQIAEVGGLPRLLPQTGGYVRLEVRFDCRGQMRDGVTPTISLTNSAFFDLVTAHIHYARIKQSSGAFDEQVITFDRQTIFLQQPIEDAEPPRGTAETILDFLVIGFDHIMGGLDHLAFLAAVMILAGKWRIMALAVTGFTIGHAITIALAVLQIVAPDAKMIEAAIGYTIALVAVEYIGERTGMSRLMGIGLAILLGLLAGWAIYMPHPRMPDPFVLVGFALFTLCYMQLVHRFAETDASRSLTGLRVGVTGLFGLIHGFGFGGSLLDLGVGRDQVITMLIGFNLGVELGQLAIIVAALILFWSAVRIIPNLRQPLLAELGMSALAGLGLYWFLARSFML